MASSSGDVVLTIWSIVPRTLLASPRTKDAESTVARRAGAMESTSYSMRTVKRSVAVTLAEAASSISGMRTSVAVMVSSTRLKVPST